MDLRALKYFVEVAEAGSFSRAAASLSLSQPALTRQIKLLEEEFGQRLMERNGRGVEITEAGVVFLTHARHILDVAEKTRTDMDELLHKPRGRITIGLTHRVAQVISTDLVEQFRARYPEALISVMEGLSQNLLEWLAAGRLDFAVVFDPPASPRLHQEILVREQLVLISSRPLPVSVKATDLVRHRLVLPSAPNAIRKLVDEYTKPDGIRLDVVVEVAAMHTVLKLVSRGIADSIVPASAPRHYGAADSVHVATIHAPVIRNNVVLAVPAARPATKLTTCAIELVRRLVKVQFRSGL